MPRFFGISGWTAQTTIVDDFINNPSSGSGFSFYGGLATADTTQYVSGALYDKAAPSMEERLNGFPLDPENLLRLASLVYSSVIVVSAGYDADKSQLRMRYKQLADSVEIPYSINILTFKVEVDAALKRKYEQVVPNVTRRVESGAYATRLPNPPAGTRVYTED